QRHRHQGRPGQPPVRGRRGHRPGVRLRRPHRRRPGQLPARPRRRRHLRQRRGRDREGGLVHRLPHPAALRPPARPPPPPPPPPPGQRRVRPLPLTGELVYGEGNNLNGIVAARGGRVLLSVQTNTGKLFRIDPRSGVTHEVDLGGASLLNGDGMLLAGRVLFVVQNRDNKIAVVRLSRSLHRGRVVATLTDPDFDVPTTIAFTAGPLYAVNARFGTPDPQPARYDIVRVG